MRNAGLSEARCQNEVSESKALAASNVTSKVRSRRVTEFSPSKRCALWWLQDRQSGGQSLSQPDAQVFQSRCWRLSVASDGVGLFDNGNVFGVRWEAFLLQKSQLAGKAASRCACRRSPKSATKMS